MDHGDAQARRASRSATSTIPSPLRSAHDAYVARHQPCVRGGHQPTGRGIGKNRTSFCYSRAPRGFLTCIWRRLVLGVAAWTPAAARARAMSFIMVAGKPIAERTFVVVRGVTGLLVARPIGGRSAKTCPPVWLFSNKIRQGFSEHQKLVSAPG